MPLGIPGDIRFAVIRDWQNGKPRDTIARDNLLSPGSVSNIINDWRNELTHPVADALRELGIMLRKSRITASQCALGFRLASIMKDLGVDEDAFRLFISEIYNHSKNIGLQPEYIAYNTKQILDLTGSIPLSQIPSYIQEKANEKRKLEENITRLGNEELDAKAALHQALNEKKVSLAELEQFSNLKIELDKLGISLADVQHFVRTIQGVRQLGYSVDSIARIVSNLEASFRILAELDNSIKESLEKDLKKYCSLKKIIEGLDQESKKLEGQNKQAERDYVNIPQDELDEVREMQQHGAIAPLIRAARGELVEFNQLKHAVITGIDITLELLTSDQKASDAFKKAREIINKSYRQIA